MKTSGSISPVDMRWIPVSVLVYNNGSRNIPSVLIQLLRERGVITPQSLRSDVVMATYLCFFRHATVRRQLQWKVEYSVRLYLQKTLQQWVKCMRPAFVLRTWSIVNMAVSLGFHNRQGISWLAELMLASQEELCLIKLSLCSP